MTRRGLPRITGVAAAVARALERRGIRAVLTGSACAALLTDSPSHSRDVDFTLEGEVRRADLDEAMAAAGFALEGDRYVSAASPFSVEFPSGPLRIGRDLQIRPKPIRVGRTLVRALSPTDSCRDRLAAYFHRQDRQGLDTAVLIARKHRVDLRRIRDWSAGERSLKGYGLFRRELARRR
jgi:hypothetical protein